MWSAVHALASQRLWMCLGVLVWRARVLSVVRFDDGQIDYSVGAPADSCAQKALTIGLFSRFFITHSPVSEGPRSGCGANRFTFCAYGLLSTTICGTTPTPHARLTMLTMASLPCTSA